MKTNKIKTTTTLTWQCPCRRTRGIQHSVPIRIHVKRFELKLHISPLVNAPLRVASKVNFFNDSLLACIKSTYIIPLKPNFITNLIDRNTPIFWIIYIEISWPNSPRKCPIKLFIMNWTIIIVFRKCWNTTWMKPTNWSVSCYHYETDWCSLFIKPIPFNFPWHRFLALFASSLLFFTSITLFDRFKLQEHKLETHQKPSAAYT